MTEDSSAELFSAASTVAVLEAACVAAGLDADGAELLRIGENAIYRLRAAPVVVRIARSLEALDDVRKEVRVARWLRKADYPAARLHAATGTEPVIVLGRHPVTFWDWIDSREPTPTDTDLAGLLRRLHDLALPEDVQLPRFSPFARVAERLARPPVAAPPEDVRFLAELYADLQEQYRTLQYVFPPGPVHGDAYTANLLRDVDGQVVLLDFEAFAYGPREWDLTVTGARREGFGWMDAEQYDAFVRVYGFDILDWPGFPVFRAIRELTMTTWLMQLVDDPAALQEFRRRVEDIRTGHFPRRWRAF